MPCKFKSNHPLMLRRVTQHSLSRTKVPFISVRGPVHRGPCRGLAGWSRCALSLLGLCGFAGAAGVLARLREA